MGVAGFEWDFEKSRFVITFLYFVFVSLSNRVYIVWKKNDFLV